MTSVTASIGATFADLNATIRHERSRRRVAITGCGVVWGDVARAEQLWDRLSAPEGNCDLLRPVGQTSYVAAADPKAEFDVRTRRRMSHAAMLGVVAARRACTNADLHTTQDMADRAVVIGTAAPGAADHRIAADFELDSRLDPFLACKVVGSEAASWTAMDLGFTGGAWGPSSACSAGNDAIAIGTEWIRSGRASVVVVGGAESACSLAITNSMLKLGVVAADARCTPFDSAAHGFTMAEGAACLVLEDMQAASDRGARILGEIAGWATTCDASHPTRPDPAGTRLVRTIREALGDANTSSSEVGLYSSHGTGTRANDDLEAHHVPFELPNATLMATKGVFGHPFGASPCLEAVAVLECFRRTATPPIWGLRTPILADNDQWSRTHQASWAPQPAVSVSLGLGGVNTAVVFRPAQNHNFQLGGTDTL